MDTRTNSDTSERSEEEKESPEYNIVKKTKVAVLGAGSGSGSGKGCFGGGGAVVPRCQAQGCEVDLTNVKTYHRRHKVCEVHAKAATVIVAGLCQRFCQQCSRFHELSEFDYTKRSCRSRLAGHNERRRKSTTESTVGEGSSTHQRTDVIILGKNYDGSNYERNLENNYY